MLFNKRYLILILTFFNIILQISLFKQHILLLHNMLLCFYLFYNYHLSRLIWYIQVTILNRSKLSDLLVVLGVSPVTTLLNTQIVN